MTTSGSPRAASSLEARRLRKKATQATVTAKVTGVLKSHGVLGASEEIGYSVAKQVYEQNVRDQARDLADALRAARLSGATPEPLDTVGTLRSRPTPGWLVEGLLPGVGVAQLSGPAGSYKSFISLDLALTVATGGALWAGDHHVPAAGDVVYVAMEGGFDLSTRIDAWLDRHAAPDPDGFFGRVELPLDLGDAGSVNGLIRKVQETTDAPKLLVIDTQGLAIPGRSEDSATEMNLVFGQCKRLSTTLGCCVLLVHHTGWEPTRERGSSAQRQAVDTSILLKDKNHLSVQKIKAAAEPGPSYFAMVEHGDSLVVEWVTDLAKILVLATGPSEEEDDTILQFVRDHPGLTKSAVASGVGGNKRKRLIQIDDLIETGRLANHGSLAKFALVVVD